MGRQNRSELDRDLDLLGLDAPTRRSLAAAGVSSAHHSQLLYGRDAVSLQQAQIHASRRYAGQDGWEHEQDLDGVLQRRHDDVKALFYDPEEREEGKRLALLEAQRNHLSGALKLTDKRLYSLPPEPTTAAELAELLSILRIGKQIKKLTVDIEVEEVKTVAIKVERKIKPVLAVLCAHALPSPQAVQQDPRLNKHWLVGAPPPGRAQGKGVVVLLYQVRDEVEVRYEVEVHFRLRVEAEV
ncbi:hypothetical protein JCM8097_006348 [Rhodosporidiobolus ruineniae]